MDKAAAVRHVRTALSEGGVTVGSWIQIPHPTVAEVMGQAGYDWVAVDLEHGAIGISQLPDLCRALELGGTLPLVRLCEGQPRDCAQALDAGAGGVIAPFVESAAQLERIRDSCRWPPAGKRGVGFSRANLFGGRFDSYAKEAQAPLLVAMIEHIRAVDALPDILAVDGLDAVMIGPYDLSASIGCTGDFAHGSFKTLITRILEAAQDVGVACGVHVVAPSPEELARQHAAGFRFLAYSIDSVILRVGAARPPELR